MYVHLFLHTYWRLHVYRCVSVSEFGHLIQLPTRHTSRSSTGTTNQGPGPNLERAAISNFQSYPYDASRHDTSAPPLPHPHRHPISHHPLHPSLLSPAHRTRLRACTSKSTNPARQALAPHRCLHLPLRPNRSSSRGPSVSRRLLWVSKEPSTSIRPHQHTRAALQDNSTQLLWVGPL